MSQTNQLAKDVPDYPLVSAASLINFCDVMADYGVDGEMLLRRHQLHPQFVQLPNAQVRYDRLVSLFEDASLVTRCPHFGVLLGRKMPVESIDLILLSSHSETFGEALSSMGKYQRLFGKGFTFEVSADDEMVCWKYFHDSYCGGDLRALSDLAVAAMLSILRFFLGDSLVINYVSMDIPEPDDIACYKELISSQFFFDNDCISICFPVSLMAIPLRGNKRMRDIMLQYVEAQVAYNCHDLIAQVSHLINVLLPTGRCCIENVADVLGIHRRTLQKKLHSLGVTFKDILRDKREEKAVYLLAKTELGVQDIAASLGYSESANFLHAFKRWLGQSPSSWRKAQQQALILDLV